MLRRIAAASAVVLCAVPAVRAQDLDAVCRQVMHPPVGAWSQLNMVGGRTNGATMRISIVGTETRRDTAYLWMEFAVRGVPMGVGGGDTITIVNKMLVAGFGPGMSEPREHIMKFGGAPAMTMPVGAAGGAQGPSMMQDCIDGKVVGWESVTVPAGTFRALHVQNAEGKGDSWVAPGLPFGLVKGATAGDAGDSGQMVLVGHGMGARSQITEAPRPYDQQLLMQWMMGGGRHQ